MNKKDPKKIFEADEFKRRPVPQDWDERKLLQQQGVFFLKDVVKVLSVDPLRIKRHARNLLAEGRSPWQVMGTRKVWNHWVVRMKVFAPYYRAHLISPFRRIDPDWDANDLLNQNGNFLLTEVCRLIPFSTQQLRYQAKKNPRAREGMGIWKDRDINIFLVDMERFSHWIRRLWGVNE